MPRWLFLAPGQRGEGGGTAHGSPADARTLRTGALPAHGALPLASFGSSAKQEDDTGTLQGIGFIVRTTTGIFLFFFFFFKLVVMRSFVSKS